MKHQKYTIIINNVAPLSVNSAYYNNRKFGLKPESKAAIAQICHQIDMDENQAQIQALNKAYEDNKHCFAVDYEFYLPTFFTKQGTISAQGGDLDNFIKILQDVVFGEIYHAETSFKSPYKSNNVCKNDKLITEISARKKFAEQYAIIVTITLLEIPKLPEKPSV